VAADSSRLVCSRVSAALTDDDDDDDGRYLGGQWRIIIIFVW